MFNHRIVISTGWVGLFLGVFSASLFNFFTQNSCSQEKLNLKSRKGSPQPLDRENREVKLRKKRCEECFCSFTTRFYIAVFRAFSSRFSRFSRSKNRGGPLEATLAPHAARTSSPRILSSGWCVNPFPSSSLPPDQGSKTGRKLGVEKKIDR